MGLSKEPCALEPLWGVDLLLPLTLRFLGVIGAEGSPPPPPEVRDSLRIFWKC
jgi:hypothetical protein